MATVPLCSAPFRNYMLYAISYMLLGARPSAIRSYQSRPTLARIKMASGDGFADEIPDDGFRRRRGQARSAVGP